MEPNQRSLSALGHRVARVQDDAPAARVDHPRARGRLVSSLRDAQEGARTRRARAWVWVVPALVLSAALALVWLRPRGALHFEVGASGPGVVGASIAAPARSDLAVRFSDGSALGLAPGARARVLSLGVDGAEVLLEDGQVEVSVVHRAHTRWAVRVGPFRIDVVGTRFATQWEPVTETLVVVLHEGAVEVSGPVLGAARRVNAGERLRVSTSTGRFEIGSDIERTSAGGEAPVAAPRPAPPEPAAPAAADESRAAAPAAAGGASASGASPSPTTGASKGAVGQEPSSASSEPPAASADGPGWRVLAREAKYKDALAAAVAEGFDGICAAAPATDLAALADTARLAGDGVRAHQAMSTLRQRFPGTPEAAAVAFHLGRSAQAAQRYRPALQWLRAYLAEEPNGRFAAEARGRLIEAADAAGDAADAQRAARSYLVAHPNGPHAAFARSVLAREGEAAP